MRWPRIGAMSEIEHGDRSLLSAVVGSSNSEWAQFPKRRETPSTTPIRAHKSIGDPSVITRIFLRLRAEIAGFYIPTLFGGYAVRSVSVRAHNPT